MDEFKRNEFQTPPGKAIKARQIKNVHSGTAKLVDL